MKPSGRPADHRAARNEMMHRVLRVPLVATLVMSAIATALGDDGAVPSAMAISILVGAPLLRVGWLIFRWFRRGDTRYGLAGLTLLAVIAAGTAVSLG